MGRKNSIQLQHLYAMRQLSAKDILSLVHRGIDYKNGKTYHFLEPKFVANLFFESSTRTLSSFLMAEHRLGLKILPFHAETSWCQKGESLFDTIVTMDALGVDAIVLRTSQENFYEQLAHANLSCTIINAGDGKRAHPAQGLTDLMTIYEHFERFEGLKIGLVGNIDYSRVAKSNLDALKKLGAKIYVSGPKEWCQSEHAQDCLYLPFDELISHVDVLMMLRVKNHYQPFPFEDSAYFHSFGLTENRVGHLKEKAIVLHPGPVNWNIELAESFRNNPAFKMTTQMKNSAYMDMAILEAALTR